MFILRIAEFGAVEAMKKFLDNEGHSIVGTLTDCYLFACRIMVLQLVPFQRIFHLWWPFWCGESGCEQWSV